MPVTPVSRSRVDAAHARAIEMCQWAANTIYLSREVRKDLRIQRRRLAEVVGRARHAVSAIRHTLLIP